MNNAEFKKRVNTKFPDKQIKFERNELVNSARIENILFYNNIYSDVIWI